MKKIPSWAQIFIGMVLGVIFGIIAVYFGWIQFTNNWIKPWGTIFLNLLKLIAIPLVFVSLVKGVTSLNDISKFSRIGLKTIVLFFLSMLISVTIGIILANTIKPGEVFPEEKKIEFRNQFSNTVEDKRLDAEETKQDSPLSFIVNIVPGNIVKAASDNANMLQVIFFAILFGVSVVLLPKSKTAVVLKFFENLNDIIIKIIDLIMKVAPYGVFALLAGLLVDFSGEKEVFYALGLYMITVIAGLLILLLILYPVVLRLITGMSFRDFFKGILPSQLVAFSTSSSAATLPVNLQQCVNEFKVSKSIANFVLPVGVTINMDGTSLYQAVAAIFIAQVFGLELTFSSQLIIVFTAILASVGSPGIPGGSIIMLIIVLNSVGIPAEGIALILGVDRPLDMLRTVGNVTGDVVVASIIAKTENGLDVEEN